jgi:hypothetical protein
LLTFPHFPSAEALGYARDAPPGPSFEFRAILYPDEWPMGVPLLQSSFALPGLDYFPLEPTACAVGRNLMPLRGWSAK